MIELAASTLPNSSQPHPIFMLNGPAKVTRDLIRLDLSHARRASVIGRPADSRVGEDEPRDVVRVKDDVVSRLVHLVVPPPGIEPGRR